MGLIDVVKRDGPHVYWPMAELTGGTAYDASGNGRDGSWSGSPSAGTTDLWPHRTFDGTDDMVSASVSAFNLYAWEAWWKRAGAVTSAGAYGIVLGTGGTSPTFLYIDGNVTGSFTDEVITHVRSLPTAGGVAYTGSSVSIAAAVWHHTAVRWNGSQYEIWNDGVLVSNATFGTQALNSVTNLFVGRDVGASAYYTGALAHAAFYSADLPQLSIKQHYAAGIRDGVVMG